MMKKTSARPYAKAIFEIAEKNHSLDGWLLFLKASSMIASTPSVQKMLKSHLVNPKKLVAFFLDITHQIGVSVDKNKELLQLLANKRRLNWLPDIACLYEGFVNRAKHILPVELTSAIALNPNEQQHFKSVLEDYFTSAVNLHFEINPAIIGGFIIRAKDTVIDSSIKGRLAKLYKVLSER